MNTELTSDRNRNISIALRALLALLFLVSAAAKLYPSPYFAMTTFEIKQLLPMGFSEVSAAYFSRTLIGCEMALGILLLQPHYFKRLVLPASFLILAVFSIHLTYEIIASGNKGNCGCFGSLLPMTPLQAVVKNVIAMGLIIWLYRITSKASDRLNFSFLLSITLACVLFVFMVGPMRHVESVKSDVEVVDVPEIPEVTDSIPPASVTVATGTDSSTIVAPEVVDEPKAKKSGFKSFYADIDKGKKLLCFFAPGCDHCKETAKQLTQLKKQVKDFPAVKIIFMDEETDLIPAFFEYAGAKYPHQVLDVGKFWQTLGGNRDTPGVFYIWNGNVVKTYDGIETNAFKMKDFKTLVQKPWSEIK